MSNADVAMDCSHTCAYTSLLGDIRYSEDLVNMGLRHKGHSVHYSHITQVQRATEVYTVYIILGDWEQAHPASIIFVTY